MKSFLKNPMVSKAFLLKLRIDFKNVDYALLKSELNIELDDSFKPSDKYYGYQSKRLYFNFPFLIISETDYFYLICLEKNKLEEIRQKISGRFNGLTLSDIEAVTDLTILKTIYPFIFEEYITSKSKEQFSNKLYEKISIFLNSFKLGLRGNELYFYVSYYVLSSTVEELLAKIAIKEKIQLRRGFSIGCHLDTLKGQKFLVTRHNDDCKEKDGCKKLDVLYEQINSNNVFMKADKNEGRRITQLLEEIEDIRTKYVHFTIQEPNNHSDVIVGIVNFGQFLMWCEDNGYL